MDKREYFDALSTFDWFYEFSDDYNVIRNGDQEWGELLFEAKDNEELQPIFKAFKKWRGGMCKGPMPLFEDF